MNERRQVPDEAAMRALGSEMSRRLKRGDIVRLEGELGAGKTTFARGVLEALGFTEPVRSPTFNLIQVFATEPPVMHADLYRLTSDVGIGLEDYLDSHLCLIEWSYRARGLPEPGRCWQIRISFADAGRMVEITPPGG